MADSVMQRRRQHGNELEGTEHVVADLLEANEQAFALLAGSIADIVGRKKYCAALDTRFARAQAAAPNAARDMLLATALQVLRAK